MKLSPVVVTEVKLPAAGVVPPIVPGDANVVPFNDDAFKLGTFVVDAITNGAVPVATVLVICPEAEIVVKLHPDVKLPDVKLPDAPVNAPVAESVVNAPVEGVVAPIVVLLIDPPVMFTLYNAPNAR